MSGFRLGRAALSEPLLEALARESRKLELFGRRISPERQANIVRGRLLLNTLRGRDNGTQSARLLGADKRVSMWQPDSPLGVIVLQPPTLPVVKHKVPLLPPIDDEPYD